MPLFSNLEDYTGKYAIAPEYPDYDWKQDMKIIPVNSMQHKDMLANCKLVLEEGDGHIDIHPVLHKLITSKNSC
jgi:hypothetical protein